MDYFKEAVPQLIPIMEVLDDKVRRKFDDPSVYIIDKGDRCTWPILTSTMAPVSGVAARYDDTARRMS
ncbi:MAG: hypothetical protein ACLR0U_10060 [Enterocloster clostridioformis]